MMLSFSLICLLKNFWYEFSWLIWRDHCKSEIPNKRNKKKQSVWEVLQLVREGMFRYDFSPTSQSTRDDPRKQERCQCMGIFGDPLLRSSPVTLRAMTASLI